MKLRNPFKKLKLRNPLKRKKKVSLEKSGVEIPKEWLEETSKPSTSTDTRTRFKLGKIRIPLLKQVNQLIAVCVLIINGVISQATLTSHSDTQPLFWLFIFNAYVALRYLWSSRG